MKAIAAIAFACAAVGCASRPFVMNVGAPLKFDAVAAANETRRAKLGDVLFEQQGRPIEVVKLETAVEQNVPVRKDGWHRVPAGTPLYRVYASGQTAPTYCTAAVTFTAIMPIGGTFPGRSCFTDVDGDKAFDQVWITGQTVSSEIQVSYWQDATNLTVKPRYAPGDVGAIAPQGKGVMYSDGDNSGARLALFYRLDGEARPISGGAGSTTSHFINRKDTLPKVVELAGARIEVQALKDGVITYRVLAGMPNEPQPMVFSRVLCDPQDPKNKSVCEFMTFTPK